VKLQCEWCVCVRCVLNNVEYVLRGGKKAQSGEHPHPFLFFLLLSFSFFSFFFQIGGHARKDVRRSVISGRTRFFCQQRLSAHAA